MVQCCHENSYINSSCSRDILLGYSRISMLKAIKKSLKTMKIPIWRARKCFLISKIVFLKLIFKV
jgi:hypothetical protein